MNGIEPIRGGDKQHLGKIEGHVEVKIGKGVVLLWIEHFQQCRSGIAAKIRADLVEFVEKNHRVAAFDAAQRLNDPARHRAYVGAAMSANLCFIAQSTKRNTREL